MAYRHQSINERVRNVGQHLYDMAVVRQILKLIVEVPGVKILLISNENGFGSGTVKVVRFTENDVHVYKEFTKDVTYFTQDSEEIEALKARRNTVYKRGGHKTPMNERER